MNSNYAGPPLLKVEDLKAYLRRDSDYVRAVDGVSFTLDQGKTMALVGESGCGKSMLARAIMGLLPRDSLVGDHTRIEFLGRDLHTMNPKQLRQITGRQMAMVFQDPLTALNPVIKVGRQITEVLRHHLRLGQPAAQERAVTLLRLVGIPMPEDRMDHYPHQLSGGLRQRVAIAIALAGEPKLLIADEPTTALDVTVQAAILDLLAGLQREKQMAMILISHNLGVVAGRTHETAVMYAGRIVEQAPTRILFHRGCMPYTRALLDAIPRLENAPHTKLQVIDGQPPDLTRKPVGCDFAPRCFRVTPRCWETAPELRTHCATPNHRFACWNPLDVP